MARPGYDEARRKLALRYPVAFKAHLDAGLNGDGALEGQAEVFKFEEVHRGKKWGVKRFGQEEFHSGRKAECEGVARYLNEQSQP